MESLWQKTASLPQFPALDHSLHVDVLVIGGGMAGILSTMLLHRAGVDCALVEADRLCSGTTGHTTAKLTAQHGLFCRKMIKALGLERTGLYLRANLEALERYRSLCREIDCDFEERNAYVYSRSSRDRLEGELAALERVGAPARLVPSPSLPFPTVGAVCFPNQAQFHPLKFAAGAVQGLQVYERTRVLRLVPGGAVTDRGTIRAERIIVATHFPFLRWRGAYFLKLYQQRSYVLALKGGPEVGGMYLDEAEGGLSLRNYGGLLLLGGGGHRTGKKGGGWPALSDAAARYFPKAEVAGRWAAQDCMSLDGAPYVGQLSPSAPDLYVATGFQKWGLTGSMTAAMVLADLVRDRENPYGQVFSPSRSILHPQLAVNALESAAGLLTLTRPRCPHMGCALKYNPQEHTWDCPCHGSRFDQTGDLLDNPANRDCKPLRRPL